MHKLMRRLVLYTAMTGCLLLMQSISYAGPVPEEARRHMARGQAAVEIAKSTDELEDAIKEFQQASRLAPDWPDPYYQLANLQEKTGKFKEAVVSLKTYLRLAPNAPDAVKVQEQIYKLEYKAEQVLTVPEIIDVLVSFRGWGTKNLQGCGSLIERFDIIRYGNNLVEVPIVVFSPAAMDLSSVPVIREVMEVTGPFLKYRTQFALCPGSFKDYNRGKWPEYCFSKDEKEIKVVSKTLVKVSMKVGDRDIYTCTFEKK